MEDGAMLNALTFRLLHACFILAMSWVVARAAYAFRIWIARMLVGDTAQIACLTDKSETLGNYFSYGTLPHGYYDFNAILLAFWLGVPAWPWEPHTAVINVHIKGIKRVIILVADMVFYGLLCGLCYWFLVVCMNRYDQVWAQSTILQIPDRFFTSYVLQELCYNGMQHHASLFFIEAITVAFYVIYVAGTFFAIKTLFGLFFAVRTLIFEHMFGCSQSRANICTVCMFIALFWLSCIVSAH